MSTAASVMAVLAGNDFSTVYAPLVRDGRMEKFFWEPDHDDIANAVLQMYKDDGISRADVDQLVRRFSNQKLDFFGALRAATYDGQIKDWMIGVAGEHMCGRVSVGHGVLVSMPGCCGCALCWWRSRQYAGNQCVCCCFYDSKQLEVYTPATLLCMLCLCNGQ